MKNLKKVLSLLMVLVLSINFFACSGGGPKESAVKLETPKNIRETTSHETVFKIGTLQLVQHSALDDAYKGFTDYLDEHDIKYTMDFQNASGEQSACETIAEKFANDNLDLVYAIATPAAQSALAHIENAPIIASAVTDPAGSGLCETNDNPRGNLTAASDLTPVDAQFNLLVELIPNAKNVGILYCSAESNSKIQADMAIAAAKARGLNPVEYTAVNSSDIQTVVESMIGNVDVIYIPTDNVMAAGMNTISTIANENKIPTIVGEEGMCDNGGYATYGIDYYELGKLAGSLAEDVLIRRIKIGDIPVRYLPEDGCKRKINKETAKILGLREE